MQIRWLIALAIVLGASSARAQGTTRVAVIDGDKLWATGGIARWVAARAKLDAERPKFKIVESPDGKPVTDPTPDVCRSANSGRLKELCDEMRRSSQKQREDQAWDEHELQLLGPIETDVRQALEQFARSRGIGLVLDRQHLGDGIVVAIGGADITAEFIKHYNAKPKR